MTQDHNSDRTWTFTSLREYLLRVVADLEKTVNRDLLAQEKAVSAALAAADKATGKAEENAALWRASANEWRGAMGDRERTFLPRIEFDQMHKSLIERVDKIERTLTETAASKGGRSEVWGMIIGASGVAGGILVVALKG